MSGKPAARLGDPTACPIPGHGTNPIAAGSPNVLLDGLPAARQGDASACGGALSGNVIPTVLINGKPATTIGTVGNHGNVVVAGSGTVLIGTSGGGATIGPVAPVSFVASAVAAIVDALIPSAEAAEQESETLDYRLELKPGGNRILTPLEIPDYAELASGTTKNREAIDFLVINREQPADSMTLEVLDGSTLIYAEADTTKLLPTGEHPWQWDGYSLAGVLDTKVLKSAALKVRLTAVKGGLQQIVELPLANESEEVDWVDAQIDRNAKTVQVTVRPSFSDGGIKGQNNSLTPLAYPALEAQAKKGIEHYWSRNGTRAQGIASGINTSSGIYRCTVQADINAKPSAKDFPLTENLTVDGGRSTSLGGFRVIHHNSGYWSLRRYPAFFPDEEFMHTAAHEFGHLILNEYGDGGLIPHYSWSHKDTSTVLTQNRKDNHYIPATGELDVMHYFTDYPVGEAAHRDFWNRSTISEQDVKGLLWLTRVEFND
ncbi:PAAR domain-containing protein [Pseudomonas subflava]|uniref:PAAR domain-containing protein n=1 Tax=Pseudomonas subflava TaxID=2952933 RepID=UPI00207AEFA6|nr:PAAR domain-containing protein [Pseudomonas subflava]